MAKQTDETNKSAVPNPRYTVTLTGQQWSVALYGIVEFLRGKWFLRGLIAALGIIGGVLLAASFAGFTISGFGSIYVFFFVTPLLLWMATVSGNNFQLIFSEEKASKEREQAEKQFEESQAPEDALTLDVKRLNEYYTINQSQARSSFRWAIFSMLLGFTTIIVGIWIFYFRGPQPDVIMSALSTTAGSVINIVSGLFLYMHNKTQQRSLFYYQQLAQLQRISLAIRLVGEHDDSNVRAEARNLVINQLLSKISISPESAENGSSKALLAANPKA